MLKNFTQSLRIDITPHGLRLQRVRRWGGAAPELLAEHALAASPLAGAAGAEVLAGALDALLAGQDANGMSACFVLSDELVRLWQVAPPAHAARLADLEAAAALRFHALFGEAPGAWAISADWNTAQPFMAAAIPRLLQAQLEAAAARHQLTIVSIVPHTIAAWNRHAQALKQGAWFGVAQGGVLALAACEDGVLRAIRHVALPQGADHHWLTQVARREALLLDMPAPSLIQLSGELPPALGKPAASDQHIATAPLGAAA